MSGEAADDGNGKQSVPVRGKRRWRWWMVFGVLVGLLGLLNGPVARWAVRGFLIRQLEGLGLHGELQVDGNLHAGLGVRSLRMTGSDGIAELEVDRLHVGWDLRRAISGEVDIVHGEGLRAVVDLDGFPEKQVADEVGEDGGLVKESMQQTMGQVRSILMPVEIDVGGIVVELRRGGETLLKMEPSALRHGAGEETVAVNFGRIDVAGYPPLAAQEVHLGWEERMLRLDRLRLVNGWAVEGVAADFLSGEMGLAIVQEAAGTRLAVRLFEDFDAAEFLLETGPLDVAGLVGPYLAKPLPGGLVVEELKAKLEGIRGGIERVQVDAEVVAREIEWREWRLDQAALRLDGSMGEVKMELLAKWLETELVLKADYRREGRVAVEELAIRRIAGAGKTLRNRYVPQMVDAPFPDGTLALSPGAVVGWETGELVVSGVRLAATDMTSGGQALPDFRVSGGYRNDVFEDVRIELGDAREPFLKLGGEVDLAAADYEGTLQTAEGFSTEQLSRWIEVAGLPAMSGGEVVFEWSGSGNWRDGRHQGDVLLKAPKQAFDGMGLIRGEVRGRYAWPDVVEIHALEVEAMDYGGELQGVWKHDRLTLEKLVVMRDGQTLAEGGIAIPMARGVRSVEELLKQGGALHADIRFAERPMKDWLAMAGLGNRPMDGKAKGELRVSGTFTDPELAGGLKASVVNVDGVDDFPATDLDMTWETKNGVMQFRGGLLQKSYGPIALQAELPLRPRVWIEEPGALNEEPLALRLEFPKLRLEPYARMVAGVSGLGGIVDGLVVVSGSIREPKVYGVVSLTEGMVEFVNPSLADLRNITVKLAFDANALRVDRATADVAGGKIQASGGVDFSDLKAPRVDVKVTGNHVLVWRDDAVILRASPDLRFAGKPGEFLLNGKVDVVESMVYRDFQIIPLGANLRLPEKPKIAKLDAPKVGAPKVDGFPASVRLDVAVVSPEAIRIAGNLATGKMRSELRVRGTMAAPLLDGHVAMQEGQAKLPFSTLRIGKGRANFSPENGWVPQLDIAGQSRVNPYDIHFIVQGSASAPKVVLRSEPPLPENEIMSLLATGSTTSSLENANASSKAIQLLIAELRSGRLPHGKRIAKLLEPLESVQVGVGQENPYTGSSVSSASLPIGHRLLLTGAVDEFGNPRGTLTFFLKFQ